MTLNEWLKYEIDVDDILYNTSLDNIDKRTHKLQDSGFIPEPIGVSHALPKQDFCCINEHVKNNNINLVDVYYSFRTNTDKKRRGDNFVNRTTIRDTLVSNNYKFNSSGGVGYLTNMCKAKFVPSPEGNGIDCHRHWEALYCKSIPIVEHNEMIYKKLKNLPVLYTVDYSEINSDYLKNMYELMLEETYDFSPLFLSTYSNELQEKIKARSCYWSNRLKQEPRYPLPRCSV
jgi:hypothetical protein